MVLIGKFFSAKFHLEHLLLVLITFSFAAILINQNVTRTHTITPGEEWMVNIWSDQVQGGNSEAFDESTPELFVFRYQLRGKARNPWTVFQLAPTSGAHFDWTWMDEVRLKVRVHGQDQNRFRLQLRNEEAKYFKSDDPVSPRFNEQVFEVGHEWAYITLPESSFYVPPWWIGHVKADPKDNQTNFNKIRWIEISSKTYEGPEEATLEIAEIKLVGRWTSPLKLYKALLWVWVGCALLVLLVRLKRVQVQLKEAAHKEDYLVELNQLLRIQSQGQERTSKTDPLTNTLNRRGLRDHIADSLNQHHHSQIPFCVILFDIDFFKQYNDQYGQSTGDQLLQGLSAHVQERIRTSDHLARWGGEEFLILCTYTNISQATILAENLRESIQKHFDITCSFGLAQMPDNGDQFKPILEAADQALDKASKKGRNQIECAPDPESLGNSI